MGRDNRCSPAGERTANLAAELLRPQMRTIIVIPTYNERDNLEKLIEAINRQKLALDILIVDDNSPDGTGLLADELSKKVKNIIILHRKSKEGLGRAYIDGFKWALNNKYEIIMQMDADLSHDPNAIPQFLDKIKDYDAVFGSRYIKGGKIYKWPLRRFLLSKFSNMFISTMLQLPTTDTTTAFKCFKRNVLEKIGVDSLKGRQNAFLINLVYKTVKSGFKIAEIPFIFVERETGESKMELKVAIEALSMVFKLMMNRGQL